MFNPKVSVIIPVYNVEYYLCQCIDSVLKQSLADIEIILVNDGSTDGSGEICNNYAKIDKRVRVFYQQNAGVSVARNLGIQKALGDWICFVDGDDILASDSVLKTVTDVKTSNPDIVIARSFNLINSEKSSERYYFDKSYLSNEFSGYDLVALKNYNRGSVCGCIFKRMFLNRFKLHFPEGLRNAEDTIFFILCLVYAENIRFSDVDFYFINQRQGSASRSWSMDRIISMITCIDFLYKIGSQYDNLKNKQLQMINYGIYSITTSIIYKSYKFLSIKNIIKLRYNIKKVLVKKLDTGGIYWNKSKISILNTSLTMYIFMIYAFSFVNKIRNAKML